MDFAALSVLGTLNTFTGRVSLTIAVGILVSLVYARRTGWSSGGLVTPGLLAIQAADPIHFAGSLALAVVFAFLLRPIARKFTLYGRERVGAAMLLAIACRLLFRGNFGGFGGTVDVFGEFWIGWIAPGLIAADMERQGVWMTLAAAVSTAIVTAFVISLLLSLGGAS